MANWWEAAPLVEPAPARRTTTGQQRTRAKNWWEDAPLVEPAPAHQGAQPSDTFQQRMDRSSAMTLQGGPGVQQQARQPIGNDLATSTAATISGIVQGIPVIGPLAQNATDNLMGVGAQLMGGDHGETVQGLQDRRQQINEAAPIANVAGQMAGGIGALGALGATQAGANAIGMTGRFGERVVNSVRSGAAFEGGDAVARGEPIDAVVANAAYGGGVAGTIPVIGAGIRTGAQAITDALAPMLRGIRNPAQEAERQVGVALRRDEVASPSRLMSSGDEAMAQQTGLPIMNVDRGGETTRALARSVANQSPEARGAIERTANDRFRSQGERATNFIRQITGGAVDDLGYQQAIRQSAQAVNRPAYEAAYRAPQAQSIWNDRLAGLMQAPAFRAAVKQAETRAANRSAVDGFQPVRNPFEFGADGSATLRRNSDGSTATPNLAFWDTVKRGLDSQIDRTRRAGDRTMAADLSALKTELVSNLDALVPQYARARQGAASFFGAEDALDAGRKFATNMRAVPEAKQAFNAMSAAEKSAFRTGYASELIDRIRSAGDGRNIIQQTFGSPASREMIETVFGKTKAREVEAFVKVEAIADQLRGAMGNSTSVRQLMELGLGGAGGFAMSGGNWSAALGGALAAKGARYAGEKANARVMEHIAKTLTSDNPQALAAAVRNAATSDAYLRALDDLGNMLALPARGGAMTAVGQ